jgi:hypothetical protein
MGLQLYSRLRIRIFLFLIWDFGPAKLYVPTSLITPIKSSGINGKRISKF